MDICLQVIIKPATHDLSYDPAKEARRQARGDIIDVFLATNIGTLIGADYIPKELTTSPRTGFVFVVGVPNRARQVLKDKFTDPSLDITDLNNPVVLLRRRYGVRVSDIPLAIRQQMAADKYITITWTQVKNFLRDKKENRVITDADLS